LCRTKIFEATADDIESLFAGFDVLISGISKEQVGPPPPAVDQELFLDNFSDPGSGLIEDEAEQEWGRGYYASTGQYVFELKPDPGAIYDFYIDETLPNEFLLEVTASYDGAEDNAYGLIFQTLPAASELEADRFYTFRITGDGYYTVEKAGNELDPLIDWTYTDAINSGAQTENALTVEGVGDDTYNFYINGQQINSITDALPANTAGVAGGPSADTGSYSGGTFGLIVDNYDQEQPVTFRFADLRVGAPAQ